MKSIFTGNSCKQFLSSKAKPIWAFVAAMLTCCSGASAFDTIVVFNEIHYHPTNNALEFVELYNQNAVDIDMTDWRLSAGIDFDFPAGTIIPGGGYLVVAADPTALSAAKGITGVMGPYTGFLDNTGERLRLRNNNDRIMDEIEYNDHSPWPIGADGSGASLSKINKKSCGHVNNWAGSFEIDGTPGGENFVDPQMATPAAAIRINELSGSEDRSFFVELYNSTRKVLPLEGYLLVSENGDEYVFPANTEIDPLNYFQLTAQELGFGLQNSDNLYLFLPDKAGLIDAVRMNQYGRSRCPDGSGRFYAITASPGTQNAPTPVSAVVINEFMYHHSPTYPEAGDPPQVLLHNLLDWDGNWRFNAAGDDLGSTWANTTHSVGGNWSEGPGPFGYETATLPVAIATTFSNPRENSPYILTYYFETEFTVEASTLTNDTELVLTHEIDDGAVFYLNGLEVGRYDMPSGDVTASTLAENSSSEASSLRQTVIDKQWLNQGTNRLSIEVHQVSDSSSDMVMGALLQTQEIVPSTNKTTVAYAANDEEWIELYNRGNEQVDLSGWQLDGGIEYTIPEGTTLAADSYLVICKDAQAFSTKFQNIRCLGDFSGSLSNRGEELFLHDALGNVADELFYRDNAPWPPAADGGGTSLELRNPHIDNTIPEAWSASDNSSSSGWHDYEFVLSASQPTYSASINGFHELRLGLLDAGVLLLDDVSVVEDPEGTATELIANGTFDSADGWRLLGTHLDSSVVSDGADQILKVIAESRMNYMNNLIECNLTSGGAMHPVEHGKNYRISFRAKWLSGTPQFRFELYYNKLAKTVILEQPEAFGTPGMRNSTYETDTAPLYSRLNHSPAVPEDDEEVDVFVAASDPEGIENMTLYYAVNGGGFSSIKMWYTTNKGGGWQATIPGQMVGALVHFYVEGRDTNGNSSFAPRYGPDSRAIYEVARSVLPTGKQSVRLNMLASEATAMEEPDDLLSNHRYRCTIITDEEDIAYDCGIRLRGSMYSRRNNENAGLNLKFPANQRYRGVHSTISVRKSYLRVITVQHIINQAGGLHNDYNDVVYQYGHTSLQDGWSRLAMSRYSSAYLDGLPGGDGAEGTVYKMEGIRVFEETQDGTTDTPKTPFPIGWVSSFDFADQGDDKEMYRHNLRVNSNFDKDDYASVIRMCATFSLSGQAFEDAIPDAIDVDQWTRQFAALSLCGIGDTYSQGNPHNFNFYARPSDGLIEAMPWDWDHCYSRGETSGLWGNKNVSKVFAIPKYSRLFYGHLYDIINETYNRDYLASWFSHYGSMMGESFSTYLTYVDDRSSYVLSQLPTQTAFIITTNNGADFSISAPTAELSGQGWINVREIYLEGSPDPLAVTWSDAETWTVTIPLNMGNNQITLQAIDHRGREVGSDTIAITNTGTVVPASAANLAVTELHYHPAGKLAEEFIELQNIHATATIELAGVRFEAGITYQFPEATLLAPGERILLVQNQDAFTAKYGVSIPISGVFSNLTRLANDGEQLLITAPGGDLIRDFAYNDKYPWPECADGEGPSLVLIAPLTNPDHNLAQNWRPSVAPGGNPGSSDATTYSGGDLEDYALAGGQLEVARGTDQPVFSFPCNLAADDVLYQLEISDDLTTWTNADALINFSSMLYQTNGTAIMNYQLPSTQQSNKQFLRLSIEPRK